MSGAFGGSGGVGGTVRCIVKRTANLSVPNVTQTVLPWTAADQYDPAGWHDPVTNPERFTCPVGYGGASKWYELHGFVIWDSNSAGARELIVTSTPAGTLWFASQPCSATGAFTYQGIATLPFLLSPGDYVEVVAWQDSGGARTISAASTTIACSLIEYAAS